jgi:hypothetical protein
MQTDQNNAIREAILRGDRTFKLPQEGLIKLTDHSGTRVPGISWVLQTPNPKWLLKCYRQFNISLGMTRRYWAILLSRGCSQGYWLFKQALFMSKSLPEFSPAPSYLLPNHATESHFSLLFLAVQAQNLRAIRLLTQALDWDRLALRGLGFYYNKKIIRWAIPRLTPAQLTEVWFGLATSPHSFTVNQLKRKLQKLVDHQADPDLYKQKALNLAVRAYTNPNITKLRVLLSLDGLDSSVAIGQAITQLGTNSRAGLVVRLLLRYQSWHPETPRLRSDDPIWARVVQYCLTKITLSRLKLFCQAYCWIGFSKGIAPMMVDPRVRLLTRWAFSVTWYYRGPDNKVPWIL